MKKGKRKTVLSRFARLDPDSKKAKSFAARYAAAAKRRTLEEAYKKPSKAKLAAWEYCESLRRTLGGRNLTVTAAGPYFFSAAFECPEGLVYVTPGTDWFIPTAG